MGNSSSSESAKRPPLKPSLSSSSTTTLKAQQGPGNTKRRKSIELPDLQNAPGGSLALTPTPSPFQKDYKGKGKALPPASTQIYHDDVSRDEILLGPNANDLRNTEVLSTLEPPISVPPVSSPDTLETTQSIDFPAALDEAIQKHRSSTATPLDNTQAPVDHYEPIPLPARYNVPASSTPSTNNAAADLPPINPPSDTVVAPLIPEALPLPLGPGASATTALIIGSPLNSDPSTPIASPSMTHAARIASLEDATTTPFAIPTSADASPSQSQIIQPEDLQQHLLKRLSAGPAATALLAQQAQIPLPAAAPLVALTGNLVNDPAAVEAVKAATVDLGAGPEGVPTLLSWTPGEGPGKEGGDKDGPEKVYVTGTFAKDWTTKIELRKKKSQPDFTALVNLPPGPHRLKFIVDTQWKTSKNLPSATDQHGNLINYLQVTKQDVVPTHAGQTAAFQSIEDEERYWREESKWTNEIPAELISFGEQFEAEEAAAIQQEEHNRILEEQGLPPEHHPSPHRSISPVPPPSLPAQLSRGILNSSGTSGQDDNSILPKPDHSVIDHLAASPISKGLLSVAITKRYRRKFATTIFYKAVPPAMG